MQTFTSPPAPPAVLPPAPPAPPAALPPAAARFPFPIPLLTLLATEVAPPLPVFATSPPIPPAPPAPPFAPGPPFPPAPPLQLLPAVPPAVVTGALTPVLAKPATPPTPVFVPLFVAVMAAWQGFANAAGAAYDITPKTKAKPIVTEIAFFIVQKSTITLLINDSMDYSN